jgi:very-short-patch-repair endonuclease
MHEAPRIPVSEFARQLRKNPTPEEWRIWQHLRCRRLGGFRFRRQRPVRPFVADFVCLQCRLIVELDGGQHSARVEEDAVRTTYLARREFLVLRFWNPDVRTSLDEVLGVILSHLQQRAAG